MNDIDLGEIGQPRKAIIEIILDDLHRAGPITTAISEAFALEPPKKLQCRTEIFDLLIWQVSQIKIEGVPTECCTFVLNKNHLDLLCKDDRTDYEAKDFYDMAFYGISIEVHDIPGEESPRIRINKAIVCPPPENEMQVQDA